jgi:hypothetical protein
VGNIGFPRLVDIYLVLTKLTLLKEVLEYTQIGQIAIQEKLRNWKKSKRKACSAAVTKNS